MLSLELLLMPELTRAEREVVELVLRGYSDREVASCRGTAVRTVANQLRGVYGKLRVNSRSELVAWCLRAGLLVARIDPAGTVPGWRLSPAELAVVAGAADGQSNKVIGHALGLAASTVANHLSSAAAKLGVRSRVELIMVYHALNPRTHF